MSPLRFQLDRSNPSRVAASRRIDYGGEGHSQATNKQGGPSISPFITLLTDQAIGVQARRRSFWTPPPTEAADEPSGWRAGEPSDVKTWPLKTSAAAFGGGAHLCLKQIVQANVSRIITLRIVPAATDLLSFPPVRSAYPSAYPCNLRFHPKKSHIKSKHLEITFFHNVMDSRLLQTAPASNHIAVQLRHFLFRNAQRKLTIRLLAQAL
jgi:hypothetical protein